MTRSRVSGVSGGVRSVWFFPLVMVLVAVVACIPARGGQPQVVYVPTANLTFLDGPPVGVALDRAGALIGLDQARVSYPGLTGSGYTIAVLDTGVDYTHPALAGRYVGGYDYVNYDADPNDDHGHGTHVAGIALSNDAVYGGLAPQAGLAALKVLDSDGSGTFDDIESGLQWVIDNREAHNIVAVNMSLATVSIYNQNMSSQITNELSALRDAGVFIACAAGNAWYANSPDPPGVANEGVAYPAADPSSVAVGSVWTDDFGGISWASGAIDYTTAADRIVSHSNRSDTMLDLVAPGAIVTSCAYGWEGANPDFVTMSGTSVASPTVAGLAVLIRQAIEENWDPADMPVGSQWQDTILQIMQDHGVSVFDGDDENDNVANLGVSFSRIDAMSALDSVVPEPSVIALLATGGLIVLLNRRRRKV